MASNIKSFQKVLDSTALAATKFIRRPPIDPKTPIQGKPRVPGSNAFKDQQDKEGRRLQKALNSISHGKNIFVYSNIRTKQVVYSLTRYLEVSPPSPPSSGVDFEISGLQQKSHTTVSLQLVIAIFLTRPTSRKTTFSSNVSTMARRPFPLQSARICGCHTFPCTSRRRKSD